MTDCSKTGDGTLDDVTDELMACTCPHHVHRNAFCKHMAAVNDTIGDIREIAGAKTSLFTCEVMSFVWIPVHSENRDVGVPHYSFSNASQSVRLTPVRP